MGLLAIDVRWELSDAGGEHYCEPARGLTQEQSSDKSAHGDVAKACTRNESNTRPDRGGQAARIAGMMRTRWSAAPGVGVPGERSRRIGVSGKADTPGAARCPIS